jgi:Tfp pilus assembly protein PilO
MLARVVREKRGVIVPLLVGLAVNIVLYLFVARPLAGRSAGAADRATAAAAALRNAERDHRAATELVEGKARADEDLNAFYGKVLPADLTAARRMTYSSLPALAKRTDVRYETRRFETPEPEKDSRLGRLAIRMVLQGEYQNLRRFIHELERAPEFVVIDDVTLTRADQEQPLTLVLSLSTFYRVRPNGT